MSLIESYKWLIPELAVTPTDGKTVKIRGKAIPRETVSRNNKKYVDEELRKAARTFIDVPITENHKNWMDKKNQLGKVNWMEYDDGSMEYVAEVWNPAMVAELRVYAKNPKASQISGVSVEADYLKIACTKCKTEFLTETAWHKHMVEVEHIHDLPLEPHGIRGRALSIVTGKESPGVIGNTLEVMETAPHNGLFMLLENVVKVAMEKEKMNPQTKTEAPTTGLPYSVREQAPIKEVEAPKPKVYSDMDACMKDGNTREECMRLMKKEESTPPKKEEPVKETKAVLKSIEKLTVKEATKFSIDACMNSGKSKEECMAEYEKDCAVKEYMQQVTGKVNEITEALNGLKYPEDNTAWITQIASVKESLVVETAKLTEALKALPTDDLSWNQKITELQETFNQKSKELTETIQNLPQDDVSWKESITKLQETFVTDTKKLTETISNLPKDDVSWKGNLATLQGLIEIETQKRTESIASIKPYNDAPLKETIAAIKPYDDSALKTGLEGLSKSVTETLGVLTQKVEATNTKLIAVETENKSLKETLEAQATENKKVKEIYELNLAAYEKDIKEYWKPLEANTALEISGLKLAVEKEKEKAQLAETAVAKTLTEVQNLQDKQQPEFKGKAKAVVKESVSSGSASSFNPYDVNRKL